MAAAVLLLGCAHPPAAAVTSELGEERRLAVADGWLLGLPGARSRHADGLHARSGRQPPPLRPPAGRVPERAEGPRVRPARVRRERRRTGGSYDLETRVRDLSIVLDVLRLDPVVLVGHGTGVQVVARYAERNPARCLGLVLVNPVAGTRGRADRRCPRARVSSGDRRLAPDAARGREPRDAGEGARLGADRPRPGDARDADQRRSEETCRGLAGRMRARCQPGHSGQPVPGPLRPGMDRAPLRGGHSSPLDASEEVNVALRESQAGWILPRARAGPGRVP